MVSFRFAHYHSQKTPNIITFVVLQVLLDLLELTPLARQAQMQPVLLDHRSPAAPGCLQGSYPLHKPSQQSLQRFQNILTKGELLKMPRKQHWKESGTDSKLKLTLPVR